MAGSPSVASRSPYPTLPSHPTDLELVDTYLRPWVKSGLKSGAFTHEADVYSDEPAVLAQKFRPLMAQQDGELAWYFYTPLRQKSVQGTRKEHIVATGAGSWKIESKPKEVYKFHSDGKDHVGNRQSFCFMRKHGDKQVRSRWLMMEFSLLGDGQEAGEASALGLGHRVLCKVYRSPRYPEREAAASPGHKAEADNDGESSDATTEEDDDDYRSEGTQDEAPEPPRKSYGKESREATLVAGDEISGAVAAALGRKEKKVQIREVYDETPAATPTLKRKADVSSSSPRTPVSATEMQCPRCGTHSLLVVTLTRAKTKSETEIAKDQSAAPGAAQTDETRASSEKSNPFHGFL